MTPAATTPVILIADDNRDTREMYELYLSTVGYNVETAADGHEAVIKTQALRPSLIVMDLHMPRVDGWAAMRRVRSDPSMQSIPIIVLTGHEFKAYLREAALSEGAVSYLMKPCLPEHLAREIAARLKTRPDRSARAL